ncbi:DUF454 family protein [Caulobacter sp. RL271]|jgi:uncharacterized membrane protein YbaN (DUF454 family)|uniref:YbaN family protein n=1 Tax=Caulobacter segnis TaxID=88688 RepID=A0ABY4ZVH8_9CAUL|nr:DUF454 family protein [Caulobacter segnis]USQ96369.1 YbaN family protein [Caulobacter segnis]
MSLNPRRKPRRPLTRVERWALDGVGGTLLAIGAVGVVTPGLPTTVFWIGAVLCFLKTRPHTVRPMLRVPVVGPAIVWFLRWRPFGGGRKRRR